MSYSSLRENADGIFKDMSDQQLDPQALQQGRKLPDRPAQGKACCQARQG